MNTVEIYKRAVCSGGFLPRSDHKCNSCITPLFIQHYHSLYVPVSE